MPSRGEKTSDWPERFHASRLASIDGLKADDPVTPKQMQALFGAWGCTHSRCSGSSG